MGHDSHGSKRLPCILRRRRFERMASIVRPPLFCLGWFGSVLMTRNQSGKLSPDVGTDKDGFCGVSRRTGMKPIIAAVNGFAFGFPFWQLN